MGEVVAVILGGRSGTRICCLESLSTRYEMVPSLFSLPNIVMGDVVIFLSIGGPACRFPIRSILEDQKLNFWKKKNAADFSIYIYISTSCYLYINHSLFFMWPYDYFGHHSFDSWIRTGSLASLAYQMLYVSERATECEVLGGCLQLY